MNETVFYVKSEYKRLKNNGANIFIMACNTMHLYYDKIFNDNENIINLSLINETINQVKADGHKKVGILGTINTVKNGLYSKALEKEGILGVNIDNKNMLDDINNIIKKIIGGSKILDINEIEILKQSIYILKEKGATSIILGCTELPIAFESIKTNIKLYDPMIITIEKACEMYYSA